ncbi:hypothetical protein [Dactylococcopsis salina]|uniref:Uncharacterized protein n=1 Tax=Dactylococcopsis salina (strain PCC 8305) TaxID=13035 RepID=K9YUJ3_DACS8|nr:hypothetical protein [Dactylococcopsis salina]AFZ50596.1 hypothetical protein Dacsa_1946 [Dactylococcopsis salina PCC 8305]
MVEIKLTNGEVHNVSHDKMLEFMNEYQGKIVKYKKADAPPRRSKQKTQVNQAK